MVGAVVGVSAATAEVELGLTAALGRVGPGAQPVRRTPANTPIRIVRLIMA
jgi:hypothetical protein